MVSRDSFRRTAEAGLAGLVLLGSSVLGGCKSDESFLQGTLGVLLGARGQQVGNPYAVRGGEALLSDALAKEEQVNVYVDNGRGVPERKSSQKISPQEDYSSKFRRHLKENSKPDPRISGWIESFERECVLEEAYRSNGHKVVGVEAPLTGNLRIYKEGIIFYDEGEYSGFKGPYNSLKRVEYQEDSSGGRVRIDIKGDDGQEISWLINFNSPGIERKIVSKIKSNIAKNKSVN